MAKKDYKGYLAFVLHAHLPYVRHPEYDDFLEEDWFYEAITETYIPLLQVFEKLIEDKIDFRITMSLTPPLISMFVDHLLQDRYIQHINKLCDLADKEVERTRWMPAFNKTAIMYRDKLHYCRWAFTEKYKRNLVNGFKAIQDAGKLEIITCGATHGFLPLMEVNPIAARAQVMVAREMHKRHLGRVPRGIWLPECGYKPGHEKFLKEAGIRYFFTDAHGVLFGSPRPKYGVFAPVYTKSKVAAFGRDLESSKAVWSAEEGYPGDYNYREFYRDIGYDLEYDYIRPYIHESGMRKNVGLKYYKITGEVELRDKAPYDPDVARETAASHAGNFVFNRELQIQHLNGVMKGRKPILVCPYDAELYGHWWYEGPQWLDYVIRKVSCDSKTVKLTTCSEYLEENPKNQVSTPSYSSWGYKGYAEVWLEGSNDWIYRHLHKAADRMVELATDYPDADGTLRRALNQAARELLLAQSSDWAFIMKTGTMVEYAVKRTKDHVSRFNRIYHDIRNCCLDEGWLGEVERRDNLFPDVNYELYRAR